jgi:hypothetical protein
MLNEPYLIQRGRFKADGVASGYDGLIQNDYMGSAEFEFGSLPQSLKFITTNLNSYTVNPTGLKCVDGRGLFLICRDDSKNEIAEVLAQLAVPEQRTFRLKERCYLSEALQQEKRNGRLTSAGQTEVWWDIDNHWIACLGKDKAKKLLSALVALRERWEAGGKIVPVK